MRRDRRMLGESVEPGRARRDRHFERGVERVRILRASLRQKSCSLETASTLTNTRARAASKRFHVRWRNSWRQCVLNRVTKSIGSGRNAMKSWKRDRDRGLALAGAATTAFAR